MSAAATLEPSARRIPEISLSAPPEPETWTDRHCPDCGLLEPHHRPLCTWNLED